MSTNLTIVIIVAIIMVGLILYAATSTNRDNSKKDALLGKAEQLRKLADQPITDSEMRDIIVQFDSLLSKSLQLKLYNSDSCGDNLKKAKSLFNKSSYDAIWKAHKLRNDIVHDGATPNDREFDQAVKSFVAVIYKLLG
ncbi:MAG: hypothetical protein QY318_04425 [Candidatus Dojkabacteria bacterium]|nr:MAG: hypothetical protein QY318_04425 [Candidatus Dojkabacteria bacterium]